MEIRTVTISRVLVFLTMGLIGPACSRPAGDGVVVSREQVDRIVFVRCDFQTIGGGIGDAFEIPASKKAEFLDWFFPCSRETVDFGPGVGHELAQVIFVMKDKSSVVVTVPEQPVGGFIFRIGRESFYSRRTDDKYAYDFWWAVFIVGLYHDDATERAKNQHQPGGEVLAGVSEDQRSRSGAARKAPDGKQPASGALPPAPNEGGGAGAPAPGHGRK